MHVLQVYLQTSSHSKNHVSLITIIGSLAIYVSNACHLTTLHHYMTLIIFCIITIYIWFHCRGSKETEVLQEHLEIKVKRYCQSSIFTINRLNIYIIHIKFDIPRLFIIIPHLSLIDLYFPRAPQDLLVIQGRRELWVNL